MKTLLLATFLILTSCGKQEHEIKIQAPEDDILSGETYSYVIIRLEFIQQMRQICEEINLLDDFDSETLHKQAVSQCTLDNLSVLDLGSINDFNSAVCDNPQTTEEQQVCDALN